MILTPGVTVPSPTTLFKGMQDPQIAFCFSAFSSITITTYIVFYRPVLIPCSLGL